MNFENYKTDIDFEHFRILKVSIRIRILSNRCFHNLECKFVQQYTASKLDQRTLNIGIYTLLGIFVRKAHKVIPVQHCWLYHPENCFTNFSPCDAMFSCPTTPLTRTYVRMKVGENEIFLSIYISVRHILSFSISWLNPWTIWVKIVKKEPSNGRIQEKKTLGTFWAESNIKLIYGWKLDRQKQFWLAAGGAGL